MAKTAGELLFESYLSSIDLDGKFEYEPAIGKKAPDYLIHAAQDVLCEVKDFGEGDDDRRIAQIPVGEARGGAFEPHVRIREKLEAAARQLREYKGQFPTVIVFHNPGFFVHLDPMIVAGGMYGNLQFVVEIGTATPGLLTSALVCYGLLLTVAVVDLYRHYLMVTFPLEWVTLALLLQKRSRIPILDALWVCQLLLAMSFLSYIHVRPGSEDDYGVAYSHQQGR